MEFKLENILYSILVVCVTFIILHAIKKYLIKKLAYKHNDTMLGGFIGILLNVLQYFIILIAIVVILKINGFNVTSLLAGLGIVATIVGLSLQDTLKDVFAGINIYSNNFYKVGDIVVYNGRKCEVKYFSARITKFKDLFTNSTYTVCNSCITSIEKVKGTQIILLSFDISDDKKKIDKCFNNVVKKLDIDKDIHDPLYLGIVEINRNGATYGILYTADPSDIVVSMRITQYIYEELAKIKMSPNTDDDIKIKRDPWNN